MKANITGRKIEVTDGIRQFAEKKLAKLDKFFDDTTSAQITLSVQKDSQTAELTIRHAGIVYRAEDTSGDMYMSIDRTIDLVERQICKNKTRLAKKLRANAFTEPDTGIDSVSEETDFKIVRSKKHAVKPMSPEEAILQMNLLGHAFFVFHNDETDSLSIVYKRKDGDYGLIEAEE